MKFFTLITIFLSLTLLADAEVSVKVGSFDKSTTTPGPTSQTVSWADGDVFTPKIVLLFSTNTTAFGDSATTDSAFLIGIATASSEEYVTSPYLTDNLATSNNNMTSRQADLFLGSLDSVGEETSNADLTSFGSRQFTVSWVTNTAIATKIIYIAIGGASIAEAKLTNQTMIDATGSQTYAHGLSGGAPDFVMFISNNATVDGLRAESSLSFGVAKSSTSRWALTISSADAAALAADLNASKQQSTSHCLIGISPGGTAQGYLFDYASADATNVTLDQEDAPGDPYLFAMLAIRGGDWTIGATNKTTSAAPVAQTIATGAPSTPALAFMASFNAASTASVIADAEMTFGMADGISEFNLGALQEDDVLNTQSANLINNTKIFRTGSADASTYTVASEADFTAFTSDGFTVNWTTNDTGVADQLLWFTAGPKLSGGIVPVLTSQRRRNQ